MKFPCEKIANRILPAIRAEIAVKLSKEYGLKQIEISKILGITQGAVSHYITSFRGKEREIMKNNPEIMKIIDRIVKKLLRGNFEEKEICMVCKKIRELSPNL